MIVGCIVSCMNVMLVAWIYMFAGGALVSLLSLAQTCFVALPLETKTVCSIVVNQRLDS